MHPDYIRDLRQNIVDAFSPDEFNLLCQDLGIRDNTLVPGAFEGKVSDVIELLRRRGRLPELIEVCKRERPNRTWIAPPVQADEPAHEPRKVGSRGQTVNDAQPGKRNEDVHPSAASQSIGQIIPLGLLTIAAGVLINLTSNLIQRALGDPVSLWPALSIVLATVVVSVMLAYLQSGRNVPKFSRSHLGFGLQGLAVFIAILFGAWSLVQTEFMSGPLVLKSSLNAWATLAGLPLTVAFLTSPAEDEFRKRLLPNQRIGLTNEKFFGAYVGAFIGQFVALLGLLMLDVGLAVWQGWPTGYRFAFWLVAQLAVVWLAWRGTGVAVTYWQNLVERDPSARGKPFGSLLLTLAFPFLVYPMILGALDFFLPGLRSNQIIVVAMFVIVIMIAGGEMAKSLKKDTATSDKEAHSTPPPYPIQGGAPQATLVFLTILVITSSVIVIVFDNLLFQTAPTPPPSTIAPTPQITAPSILSPLVLNQPMNGTLTSGQTACYTSVTEQPTATLQITATSNADLNYQLLIRTQAGVEIMRETSPHGAQKLISFAPEPHTAYQVCIQGYDDFSKGGYVIMATLK